jgi:hypothetical protein
MAQRHQSPEVFSRQASPHPAACIPFFPATFFWKSDPRCGMLAVDMRAPDKSPISDERQALHNVLANWASCAEHLQVLAVQVLGLTASLPADEAEAIRARLSKTRLLDLAVPNAELFDLQVLDKRVQDFKQAWSTRHVTMANLLPEAAQTQ